MLSLSYFEVIGVIKQSVLEILSGKNVVFKIEVFAPQLKHKIKLIIFKQIQVIKV